MEDEAVVTSRKSDDGWKSSATPALLPSSPQHRTVLDSILLSTKLLGVKPLLLTVSAILPTIPAWVERCRYVPVQPRGTEVQRYRGTEPSKDHGASHYGVLPTTLKSVPRPFPFLRSVWIASANILSLQHHRHVTYTCPNATKIKPCARQFLPTALMVSVRLGWGLWVMKDGGWGMADGGWRMTDG